MPTIKIPNGDKKFFNAFIIFYSLNQLSDETDGLAVKPDKCLDDTPHRAGTQCANPKITYYDPPSGVKRVIPQQQPHYPLGKIDIKHRHYQRSEGDGSHDTEVVND